MRLNFSWSIAESPAVRMFLVSFLILYLELTAIRFIPSQIRYVGYFSNIILLACFAGIGLGTIFWEQIKIPLFLLPPLISFFELSLGMLKYDLVVSSDEVIYFSLGAGKFAAEPIFLLPLVFFLVVSVFLLPAKLLGELFTKLPPLSAYGINIVGSIAGIVTFSLVSFFRGGPIIWFPTIFIISFLLMNPAPTKAWILRYLFLFCLSVLLEFMANYLPVFPNPYISEARIYWSPYYKVSLYRLTPRDQASGEFLTLSVNNVGHQNLLNPDSPYAEAFYQYPYKLFPERTFKDVLVIGAGAGNDVAKALRMGAERVVAVEIDPVIAALGKEFHPENPYSSDKVEISIDDGRSYLVRSREKFDLIIFALTDSLTLTSAASNLRLESYLFTKQAFEDAKALLARGGLLVLYNYYRSPWIVDKLGILLRETFGRNPYIISTASELGPAAVLIGAEPDTPLPPSPYLIGEQNLPIPVDDWPFLYLRQRAIPLFYWSYLGVILVALGIVFSFLIKKTEAGFDIGFFFLGAAFMLLETKNVVQFSLLFGSTWLTNAFVFTGLLILVLLAIWMAKRLASPSLPWLFALLFVLLAGAYFIPQRNLLSLPYVARLISATAINFSPVFVANLIFAILFKQTKIAPMAYGTNIFGAVVGGVFEYTSLIWGYKNLLLFVALFYSLALSFALKTPPKGR